MTILVDSFIVVVSLVALWFVSDKTIEYASRIASMFGISNLLIGFVVLSVATGLPELSIAIQSIIAGQPGLSAGNILGANFSDVSLCLGLAVVLFGPLITNDRDSKKHALILFLSAILMGFVFIVGHLRPSFGVILIGVYVAGITWLWRHDERLAGSNDHTFEMAAKNGLWGTAIKLSITLIGVLVASKFAVSGALSLSKDIGLSPELIGAVIIGAGASLPELSLNLQAVRKKKYALALGNSLGSVFEQGGLILGILALGAQKEVPLYHLRYIAPFMFLSYAVVGYSLFVDKQIGMLKGFFLLGLYLFFVYYSFFISGQPVV